MLLNQQQHELKLHYALQQLLKQKLQLFYKIYFILQVIPLAMLKFSPLQFPMLINQNSLQVFQELMLLIIK